MPKATKRKEADKESSNFWFALSIAGQLGWMIALPVVMLALVGRYLDIRFGSSPILLLTGILLSIMISSWVVYFKVIKIFTELEKSNKETKDKQTDNQTTKP